MTEALVAAILVFAMFNGALAIFHIIRGRMGWAMFSLVLIFVCVAIVVIADMVTG